MPQYDPYLLEAIKQGILGKEIPLILLHKGTKQPLWPGWQRKAISKIPKLEDLERHNIGLKLNNIAVIDVDKPAEIKTKLPPTTVVTRKKGVEPEEVMAFKERGHIYFKKPDWLRDPLIRKSLGIYIGPGRQMVIPPSVHPSGERYRWHSPERLLDLPELPKELVEELSK